MSSETHGDCRSEEGITAGLIDAVISIARVLARRDLDPPEVREALADLRADEDIARLIDRGSDIDWTGVEAAVQRGIRDYARAYWIPANFLCGGVLEAQDRMAANWAKIGAPFVTACIREDLRKAGDQHVD